MKHFVKQEAKRDFYEILQLLHFEILPFPHPQHLRFGPDKYIKKYGLDDNLFGTILKNI